MAETRILHDLKRIAHAMTALQEDSDRITSAFMKFREDSAILKVQVDRLMEDIENGDAE